jgi:hypothetical protein
MDRSAIGKKVAFAGETVADSGVNGTLSVENATFAGECAAYSTANAKFAGN